MPDWIHPLAGGYVTLPCWRDDLGTIPSTAYFTVPSLGLTTRKPAAIMRDGLVRGRLNPGDIPAGTPPGDHTVVWSLTVPIDGMTPPDDPVPSDDMLAFEDQIDTIETLTLTLDPLLLDRSRLFKDAEGFPTPKYLREKQLFGIPPFDANNRLLTDVAFQNAIEAAIYRVENELGIELDRKSVV